MPTIKDVAKKAGVAVSTASYALSGKGKVSASTLERVRKAAVELNYQKNGFASDLKSTRTNTIALILSDLSGPYYSELIKGVQDVTSSNGYGLIACSSIGGKESTANKFLREKRVDGAIVLAHNIDDDLLNLSANQNFPIVVLDRNLANDHIIHVEVNNEDGARKATEHLIERGHNSIAFVAGPNDSHDSNLRFNGYINALEKNNLTYYSRFKVTGDFTRDGGYRATRMLIAQQTLPEAIFYANDEMAIGGLQALKEKAIKVPEDISIIGYDDIQLAEYAFPSLTTIRQPKYEIGALSAHMILQILSGEEVEKEYMLETELILRESVK